MTVTRRISVGYLGVMLLVLILAGAGVFSALEVHSWSADFKQSQVRVDAAATIHEASANMVVYGAGAALASDATVRQDQQSAREGDKSEVDEALATLAGLEPAGSDQSASVKTMKTLFAQCDQSLTATVTLAATDREQAISDISGKVLPLASQLDDAATTYGDNARAQAQSKLNLLNTRSTMLLIVVVVVAVLAIIAGVLANTVVVRMIGRQLRRAISSLNSSSAELLGVASQVAAAAAQTAASTNETTATVEEVKQTALLAQEKAAEASELSKSVVASSEFGENSSKVNYHQFERILSDMQTVADAIERLNEQAASVADIITTVNDLAEQSNLLSVNASIEAAKAGEQGKGFTVVAQEVKNLAGQSKQAVTHVRAVLTEIQKASTVAVNAAVQSREAVEAGRVEAEQAIEGTHNEVGVANRAAEATLQIAASSRQQLAGMEQISQAIASINEAGNQSASGTRQVEREVKHLQELALSLRRLVDAKATA